METAPRRKSMAELDRFKRRLIRAVARLQIQEKKQEDEIWTQLKIETGSNCKLLWTRMRALTEKKLSHLLAVNDRTVAIPRPARMSLTDWLLFDLVLVHQKIDLIGQDRAQGSEDPEALVKLFDLVKKFRIEGLSGDQLAEAWSNATLYYNNKGHQCSPMLLQRRWYQLKELTRAKFYDFWYAYRGTVKRLALAEPHTPSPLQAAIAKTYKHLVTSPFLEWEELIERRLVTLPEEFERQMLQRAGVPKRYVRRPDEDGPDLEVIEPRIETIDLRNEPDDDNYVEEMDQSRDTAMPTVKIKEEPLDSEMDIGEIQVEAPKKSIYDSVLESTDMENEKLECMDAMFNDEMDDEHADDELYTEEKEIEETIATTLRDQEKSVLPQITNVFGNVSDANVLSNIDMAEQSDVKDVKADEKAAIPHSSDIKVLESSSKDDIEVKPQDYDTEIPEDKDNIKETGIGSIDSKVEIDTKVIDSKDSIKLVPPTDNLPKDVDTKTEDNVEDVVIIDNTPAPVLIPDSDDEEKFENSDDVIDDIFLPAPNEPIDVKKYMPTDPVPDDDENVSKVALISEENESKKPDITGFSFGQLSNDISFADEGIVYVEEEMNNEKKVKTDDDDSPKIDPKLLMLPIVYTTRLDHMALTQFQHINDKTLIDTIAAKSKPIKLEPQTSNLDEEDIAATSRPLKQEPQTPPDENTIPANSDPEQKSDTHIPPDDSDSDDDKIPDSKRVKPTSYMLQKPRSRSYNPIQLCKNPDFNTRLKWLTVGFFTIPRNRGLIKTCKPLTIDVSKAFESKLIEGRLYLKPNDVNIKTEDAVKDDVESVQSVTVLPSAMPVQSLINNSKIPDIPAPLLSQFQKPTPDVASTNERNKVINLPDISEIRRINQRLLTAEVTPIQVQNNQPQVPVSIITSPNTQNSSTKTTGAMPEINTELLKEADDVRGPPKCVDITKDLPEVTNKNEATASDTHMAKKSLGRPIKMVNGKRLYPVKQTPVAWKPRAVKERIPWLNKMNEQSINNKMVDETLLTLDTLNKMLFLLIEKEDEPVPSNQKKCNKKNKKTDKSRQNEQSKSGDDSTRDDKSADNLSETAKKNCKVKINVRAAEPRALLNSTLDKTPTPVKKQVIFCCWSRQRMIELLFSKRQKSTHSCPTGSCMCCCQNLLKDYIMRAMVMKGSIRSKSDDGKEERVMTYISSTLHKVDKKAKNSELVAVPVKVVIHFPPTSAAYIEVEALNDTAEKNVTTIDVDGTPDPATKVDVSEVETPVVPPAITVTATVATPVTSTVVSSAPTPEVTPTSSEVPSVRVAPPNPTARGIETPVNVSSGDGRIRRVSADMQSKIIPYICDPKQPTKVLVPCNTPPRNDVVIRRLLMPKTVQKTSTPPIIRCSMPLASKPAMPPNKTQKKAKEKMIFINSKQLTEKPTECPIFLGKNKILLTTVKFPHNLKQFEDSKLALASTLNLPKGVQLTCLSDGTLSYSIDKNVPVNVQDIAQMPAIIAAVRAHMNANSPAASATVPRAAGGGEVVDLIDDDEDVTAKSTTEHNKNSVPSSATEERSEINTNNQTAVTNQYSFIDMQDAQVQTPSVYEEPSVEVQDQPNTSGVENNQLGSTTQNVSTEMQQPLVEQVNDNPEPPIQKEVTEVSNQVEPESERKSAVTDADSASEASRNKSKNILSDLMEMSGIFDEDMTAAEPAAEPSVQAQPALPRVTVDASTSQIPKIVVQPNLDTGNTTVPLIKTSLGELSPITSLYELKYACLNKGTFFKLDFSTGYLVPINVCMKQNVKQVPPPPVRRPIAPKSVIDLTDEDDTSVSSEAATEHTADGQTSPGPSRSLLIASNPPTGSEVKPVKMYKALTPNILRILDKAKLKRKQIQEQKNESKIDHKLKRKQVLVPDDRAKQIAPVLETATISSDDSSDEEPLSNLVKRRKENEENAALEQTNENEPEQRKETELEFTEFTETTDDVDMSDVDLTSKEALIEVDMAQSNDEEEGCILGV
uniref:Uncharacterized protein n=1 Tax=Heliothis virescens TaxID=7102 RepID=A0A2A4JYS2_HELVI